jgi:hypothetical protein
MNTTLINKLDNNTKKNLDNRFKSAMILASIAIAILMLGVFADPRHVESSRD